MPELKCPSCGAAGPNPTTANRFQVRSIPTVLLFRDGQLVDRIVGVQPRSAFEAHLQPLLSATA